ncbi:MAG: conjugal transfer protein TraD [Alphaproteobacteria bacterium]|nr:conjugal transfer protein TraD [Alphaproteobacteria bacterium]
MTERKADTHDKIMLGGLVINLACKEEFAVILGILTLAAEDLSGPGRELARHRFGRAGD